MLASRVPRNLRMQVIWIMIIGYNDCHFLPGNQSRWDIQRKASRQFLLGNQNVYSEAIPNLTRTPNMQSLALGRKRMAMIDEYTVCRPRFQFEAKTCCHRPLWDTRSGSRCYLHANYWSRLITWFRPMPLLIRWSPVWACHVGLVYKCSTIL